ncbi:MAG TPA: zinc-ribbon domain containing protein [Verrucomicrobiae bacterium]|nr:zinc-ribbon domain containing protein [Verrucomicrobiae bacterium]
MFQDKELTCKDCGNTFVFTTGEQEFYAEKGFENEPTRCRECRNARKAMRNTGGGVRPQRELHKAVCAECGVETEVPFKPVSNRPVYCRECFARQR